MGVRPVADGVNVVVHAPDADCIYFCLFDAADQEIERLALSERVGPIWRGAFPGIAAGMRYGLRAAGPWDPMRGLRFNMQKLLVDPWALALDRPFKLHPALFDTENPVHADTAQQMPKAFIGTPNLPYYFPKTDFDWDNQVIYELHVRGFSRTNPAVPEPLRGTFAGLAHPASIAYLQRLGITTVEVMPSAAWADERHLPPRGLANYWGYNPAAFLAPDPRIAPGGWAEIRAATDALREAGIATILDVVLNHSAESDHLGPTLSLRGLDNAGYYRLGPDKAQYVNDAGCGNILALDRPHVVQLAMDALRAWTLFGGFDGFRLDLATTLGRRSDGFDPAAPLLTAICQDPVLCRLPIIAEPWDIGPGGYQLGHFPSGWGEWNDQYRDTVRRFWRGDPGMLGAFTTRFAGSADIFRTPRPLTRSINFITAHDGFTLADLVSYTSKHNTANGEDNRDGTDDNISWNHGVEGLTEDAARLERRKSDIKALLATLLLSRGTPMLAMGDEAGRSQGGNNNAYAQDNVTTWFDWTAADQDLIAYTADLIAIRKSLAPVFGSTPLSDHDVVWRRPDGARLTDWNSPHSNTLIADVASGDARILLVFHAGLAPLEMFLPDLAPGSVWTHLFDTAPTNASIATSLTIAPRSVVVLRTTSEHAPERAETGTGADDQSPIQVDTITSTAGRPWTPGAATKSQLGITDDELKRLAGLAGIDTCWWDIDGACHAVPVDSLRSVLHGMRLPTTTRTDWRSSLAHLHAQATTQLPTIAVGSPTEGVRLRLGHPRPRWVTLIRQDGSEHRLRPADNILDLPPQPMGQHRLIADDDPCQVCHLIIAPRRCYLPPALAAGERRFGIAAHLYTLRSAGDQGIGDFSTLSSLARQAAQQGAALVGLNPLHAMFPHDRHRASPYQPSDRRFLDPIYIDVSHLPGGAGMPIIPGAVDYDAVWGLKRAVLHAAYRAQAAEAPTRQAPISASLKTFATYQAIVETLGTSDWTRWPTNLRHPSSAAVGIFAETHRDLVGFHEFLQLEAEAQLARSVADTGLSIGLYRDLAVGAAPDGAEAWAGQDCLMSGLSIGAPPDPFAANGQVWCLPPPDPIAMRRGGYELFAGLLEANMRHAGALRIDHAIGLRRLFVVPDGAQGRDGAYVNYRLNELLAQISLHSNRARCLIVGEDLGTVPEGLPEALAEADILSYSVLWFEREHGRIRPQSAWKQRAAACVSTHDLPTLAGWWSGTDIAERHALGLLADDGVALAERATEKTLLRNTLQSQGLVEVTNSDLAEPLPDSIAAAIHRFVAGTPALLALVQADDLVGDSVAVNLPGTDQERPNWRRRLDQPVETMCSTPLARGILSAMHERADTAVDSSVAHP